MTLLALYWSIMIACYLLASRLRKYAEKFKFVDKLMSLSVYALVLLMGLRMGADEEVTSSLGSIGIQALFVTVLTAAGSMLGAFAVRKLLHIDRHAHPAGAVVNEAEAVHEKADVSGVKMSFIILLMVVVGMLLGDLVIRRVCTDLPAFQSRSGDYLVVGLCIMLGLIGFSMGLDGSIARILRNAGLGVILVPIFAVLGTLLGGRGLCRALTHDAARGTGHQRRLRLVHDGPERHRKRGAHDGERGLVSAQCAARDARYHSAARHRGQDWLYRGHHHPWHRLD